MRKQLAELRERMKQQGINVYVIPTTDFHGSEYVNDHFKCREFVSGFTGSAGTLIVEQDHAGLWTDGRYFVQAAQQLAGSGIDLMRMGETGVPTVEEYLDACPESTVMGFDGRVMPQELGRRLEKRFRIVHDIDLVGRIWEGRPDILPSEIHPLPMVVTGESADSKRKRIRSAMGDADYLLLSSLEEIAWLYNLRGSDIKYTPVFYGFALISRTQDTLYTMGMCPVLPMGVHLMRKKYEALFDDLAELRNCTVMLDERTVSYSLSKVFDESVTIRLGKSPAALFKAVKNQTEITATKHAHIRDGAAVTEFIFWLKQNIGKTHMTEKSAADYLENCRRKYGAYDLSFETISAYEAHGAIIHYAVTKETDAALNPEGFLLVDSGGQYEDGTTDITRTIALGKVSRERKRNYTAVLQGHVALAISHFDESTTGAELDQIARKPLQEMALDYNHGTGHGVGHMLSVHEGPNIISRRGGESRMLPGMITSDEPGIYLEGEYGIRIENELLCIESEGHLAFETITFCPYERDAIETEMLTQEERGYIDSYHEQVYQALQEFLDEDVRVWLAEVTRPL